MDGLGEIRTVGNVQAYQTRLVAAFYPAVDADDGHGVNPGHVAGESAQGLIAFRLLLRGFAVNAGDDLQKRAQGIDDTALRFGAAASEIDDLGLGDFDALRACPLQPANALEDQRRNGQQRDHDQPRPNAEQRLAALRRLVQFCLQLRHARWTTPYGGTLGGRRKSRFRASVKI